MVLCRRHSLSEAQEQDFLWVKVAVSGTLEVWQRSKALALGLLQEADESQLWLELLRDDCGIRSDSSDQLHRETGELIAIFTAMVSRTKRRS